MKVDDIKPIGNFCQPLKLLRKKSNVIIERCHK